MRPMHMMSDTATIRRCLARPGMTKLLLADQAAVSRNVLTGVEGEEWNPRRKTLEKLAAAARRLGV